MDVDIIREEKNELEISVVGEGTLIALLREYLLQDEDVAFAAFKQEHPLTDRYFLLVRTKKGKPREALVRALERIKSDINAFRKEIKGLKI